MFQNLMQDRSLKLSWDDGARPVALRINRIHIDAQSVLFSTEK